MEKYLRNRGGERAQLLQLSDERLLHIEKVLRNALREQAKTESLCKLVCSDRGSVAPGLKAEAQLLLNRLKSEQEDIKSAYSGLQSEIQTLKSRIARLESDEYRREIEEAAVDEASRYAEAILETHKQQQEKINEVVQEQLQQLQTKKTITQEELTEFAEKVSEAAEETPKLPESLLESIRNFQGQLRPVQTRTVPEEQRDSLMAQLAQALERRRQALEG